jgi:hypothetical protein
MRRTVTFLALSALVVGLTLHAAQGEVQTAGLDTLRTDWDQAEPTLSAANVVSSDFGQLFSTRLNGQIYAQPLVIGSTVIASTENDWVYGLDASTGRIKFRATSDRPGRQARSGAPTWPPISAAPPPACMTPRAARITSRRRSITARTPAQPRPPRRQGSGFGRNRRGVTDARPLPRRMGSSGRLRRCRGQRLHRAELFVDARLQVRKGRLG